MISLATLIRNHIGFGKKPGKRSIASSSDGIVLSDVTRQAIVRVEEGITEQLVGAVEVSWQFVRDLDGLTRKLEPGDLQLLLEVIGRLTDGFVFPQLVSERPLAGDWCVCDFPKRWELVFRRHGNLIQIARAGQLFGKSGQSELYIHTVVC